MPKKDTAITVIIMGTATPRYGGGAPMNITVLTLFPAMFDGPFGESIVRRAADKGIVRLQINNIRDYAKDKHHSVDDSPYGGGAGMVMKPDPLFDAVEDARRSVADEPSHVVLLTPQGRLFHQAVAAELSEKRHLVLICGHYEGVDERVHRYLVDDEVSLGDFILTGGEPAALAIVDAVVRLLPGVLGDPDSVLGDTFSNGLLQHPQYTRPPVFRGWEVPQVLLSGDHQAVDRWRRRKAVQRTEERRPELLGPAGVSQEELADAKKTSEDDEAN